LGNETVLPGVIIKPASRLLKQFALAVVKIVELYLLSTSTQWLEEQKCPPCKHKKIG
jgi:hypothetical protein